LPSRSMQPGVAACRVRHRSRRNAPGVCGPKDVVCGTCTASCDLDCACQTRVPLDSARVRRSLSREREFIPFRRSPSASFASSRPSDPSVGPAPTRFLDPSTTPLELAPCETGVTLPRFRSRAFSTPQRFASRLELRGLVSCRSRSWASSSRVFPSQESRAPLEAACSPVVIHQRSSTRASGLITASFPDAHARARWPGSPDDYGRPFLRKPKPASSRTPRAPTNGIVASRQLHPLRSLDPPASPFTNDPGCPEPPGRSSPGLSPLKSSPPTPGSLEPAYASRRKQRPVPEGAGLRRKGLAPLDRVGPPPGRSLAPIPSAA